MDLAAVCFILFGFLFTGFLVLEGFDYGVGMLLPFLGRTDVERQAIIKTFAPVWEGNEVWMITAGAVLFAGFPDAYATLFSGLYLALFLILSSLILRGVAFEFRDKDTSRTWRSFWDWSVFTGSLIPALLWGIALANLLQGLPIDAERQYIGTFMDLISPYTLISGLSFVFLFLVHGATYLTVKLEQGFANRIRQAGLRLCRYTTLLLLLFTLGTYVYTDLSASLTASMIMLTAVLEIFLIPLFLHNKRYTTGFVLSTLTIISLITAIFTGLFPRLIVSSLNLLWSMTIYNAAANLLTLKIMNITLSIALPVILSFEIWKYYIFRRKISTVEIELAPHAKMLRQMNKDLKKLIKQAGFLADMLDKAIHIIRKPKGQA